MIVCVLDVKHISEVRRDAPTCGDTFETSEARQNGLPRFTNKVIKPRSVDLDRQLGSLL